MRIPTVVLGALLAAVGWQRAQAQDTRIDPRWLPWLGCWERVLDAPAASVSRLACVVPAEGGTAAEIVTIVDGAIVTRERLDASPEPRAVDQDGCSGTERITWSADGRRLFRTAELDCQGGLHQQASQLIAMSAGGQWLDVQGVTVGGRTGLRVIRYREAAPGASLPESLASRLPSRSSAAELARTAASAPARVSDVVEASRLAQMVVVQAWLTEQDRGFELTGRRIAELADQGVPGDVIDVMIAISYPKAFRVDHATQLAELRQDSNATATGYGYGAYTPGALTYGQGRCDPYIDSYSLYGRSMCDYGYGYGYGPYGYGYGWGGWWWGNQPIIVVGGNTGGAGSGSASHGRVVNGSGYQRGAGDPNSSNQGQPRPDVSGPTGSGSPGSGASSSGSSGSASGSSTPSAGAERTAKPRP